MQSQRHVSRVAFILVAATMFSPSHLIAAEPAATPKFDDLPQGIASLGAAIAGDWLYVYGGHTGKTHEYSTEQVSKGFRRINIREGGKWEELPSGPALQGLTLTAFDGKLYRVGGMTARNAPGAPQDLLSLDSVARFDPETKTWTDLPPLPDGRSSHGAEVVDGKLYVIGGWQLRGTEEPRWHETALILDLHAENPRWNSLPTPSFQRRASGLAAIDGKLFAIGGLQAEGGISQQVDFFDIAKQTWTTGPAVPGMVMNANGVAAATIDSQLFISGMDGNLYRLNLEQNRWDPAAKVAPPRIHHRLLPAGHGHFLAVGGATMAGNLPSVNWVSTDAHTTPK